MPLKNSIFEQILLHRDVRRYLSKCAVYQDSVYLIQEYPNSAKCTKEDFKILTPLILSTREFFLLDSRDCLWSEFYIEKESKRKKSIDYRLYYYKPDGPNSNGYRTRAKITGKFFFRYSSKKQEWVLYRMKIKKW